MQHVVLTQNLLVVACGKPARVVREMANAQVEVQMISDHTKIIVHIDELQFLPVDISETVDSVALELKEIPNVDEVDLQQLLVAKEQHLMMQRYKAKEISIEDGMRMLEITRPKFFRIRRAYDPLIGPQALLPLKRGRKTGQKTMPSEVEDIIEGAIKKKYKGPGATYAEVWQEVHLQCSKLKIKTPSRNSVVKRIKEVGARTLHKLKYGAESASQKYGSKPGKKNTSYPLEIVQIDHTRVDCMLCDEETRTALARPWVTLLIDVFTRVILGFYVAFHAPSALSVACALTHAVLPKRKYLESLGCAEVLHPFYGVPKVLHMDNAKEFRSPKLQRACVIHGISPEYRPPGRKHFGGHIERLIGTMMTSHVHFLPGTTKSNSKDRGDYPSEKKAVMTFKEFTGWFARQVGIYNYSEHSGLQKTGKSIERLTPAEAWSNACNSAEAPKISMITDQFKFRLDFMPEEERVIHPNGVFLYNDTYWAPELRLHVGPEKRVIKYDPFSMRHIWVRVHGEYIQLRRSDVTADDHTYEEHLIAIAAGKAKANKGMSPYVVGMRESSEKVVKQSAKDTKRAKQAREAEKAYSSHTVNQLFDSSTPPAPTEIATDIDFSTAPTILNAEEY